MQFSLTNYKNIRKLYVLAMSTVLISLGNTEEKAPALPMKRILEAAKQKGLQHDQSPFGHDGTGSRRDESDPELRRANQRRTRVYTMSPLGLTLLEERGVRREETLEGFEAADSQREADANDGDDITAFEEVGAPLDPQHLSEFKVCSASRTEQGLNDTNTYWLSALSSIAYLKYPLAFEQLKRAGFESIVFIEGPSDIEVFVAKKLPKRDAKGDIIKDSGLSVVAFRGSDDPEDWLTNLDATTSDISEHSGEAWLHEGFAYALEEVYSEIIKALDLKNNPSPIFVTGHSQGGALGTQMIIRMVSSEDGVAEPLIGPKDDRIRGLYVFAVPRVGNQWARNILDKYMNRTRNVAVNIHSNADPAPKAPFDWMGYKRAGVQAVIPYSSKEDGIVWGRRSDWTCHNDADYRGPGAFSSDLWYTSVEAHYLRNYTRHIKHWRSRVREASCEDASVAWGPRFEHHDPAAFKPLKLPHQVGRHGCDYTVLSWGSNVQL